MIKALSHCCIYVLDQDSAKTFYTEKLGFTLNEDVALGDDVRWVTVSPPDQPDLKIILADCSMGHDAETANQIRALVAKGAIGPGVLATDDCRKSYQELVSRGVTFTQEPTERFYGIEALFRDDSGNWFSLSEAAKGAQE